MEKKYKILWLDDDFEFSDSNMSINLKEFNESPFSSDFDVKTAVTADDFILMFRANYFDAVILDVWGKENIDDSKQGADGFRHALEPVVNASMVKIVYTGKGEEQPYAINDASEKGCYVIGKKDCSVPELFDILREKLSDTFSLDFPCVSDILKANIVSADAMVYWRQIRSEYNEVFKKGKDPTETELTSIRKFLEFVFKDELLEKDIIPVKPAPGDNVITLGNCLKELQQNCHPELVQVSFEYLGKVANKLEHRLIEPGCFFKNYGLYFLKSIYNALFICLIWYSKFLAEDHRTIGCVEYDKELQVYHVNDVLLPSMSQNDVGTRVRLSKKIKNTQSKTKRTYPYFSKYERIGIE